MTDLVSSTWSSDRMEARGSYPGVWSSLPDVSTAAKIYAFSDIGLTQTA